MQKQLEETTLKTKGVYFAYYYCCCYYYYYHYYHYHYYYYYYSANLYDVATSRAEHCYRNNGNQMSRQLQRKQGQDPISPQQYLAVLLTKTTNNILFHPLQLYYKKS